MKKFSFVGFMKKHYVFKESLLAMVFTIIVTYGISFIPFKFEYGKGIHQEFMGFDIYDLHYAGRHLPSAQKDSNIVIVEIGQTREDIANQINTINKNVPAVIGIDAVFEKEGDDQIGNYKLLEAIGQSDNIVLGCDENSVKKTIVRNFFEKDNSLFKSSYLNITGDSFTVIREYPPFQKINDSLHPAFTSTIVKKFYPEKFKKLIKRKHRSEIINYTGNLESYVTVSKKELKFYDSTGQLKDLFQGKIVLLGYFAKEYPFVMEDIYFSPVSKKVSGKSFPDMYGVIIQANILSMVLGENYAIQAPMWISYLIAILITFLFLFYMLSQYKKKEHPKHGKFLLIQLLIVLVVLYMFVKMFEMFQLKVSLMPIMISIVLCLELLGVYKNIALWMHKKYKYKTVFAHKHII